MNSLLGSVLSFALLASPATVAVWKVGPRGLATIGDAIALAADGDIVLVQAGTYPGFTVEGKSLSIVADAGALPVIAGNVAVHGLAAAQTVTLQGLKIQSYFAVSPVILCTQGDGALWVEDCVVNAGLTAVEADNCASVLLRRSSFSAEFGGPESSAVVLRDSVAEVFACSITGGQGQVGGDPAVCSCTRDLGGPGGNGIFAENCMLLLQASTVQGGKGGAGDCCEGSPYHCGEGGPGGIGLISTGTSEVKLVQSTVIGGAGGEPGEPVCGAGEDGKAIELLGGLIQEIPEVPRSLEASSPLREGELALAVVSGEPGQLLALYISYTPASIELPSLFGLQLLAPPVVLFGSTVLPARGSLQLTAPVPDLGTSVEGLSLRLQTVGLSASGGFALGEAATIICLDAGL